MDEDFEIFLKQKKIDAQAFKNGDKVVFEKWLEEFSQLHPDSFVMNKKFFINNIRRKYQLKA
jgi:poly(3-hydroxyalkanoate) synthetase